MLTQIAISAMAALFALPKLNYEMNDLEPVISQETIEFHYGKHLQAYVNTLNTLVKDTEYEKMTLEEIVTHAPAGPVFNNAGQVLNHALYFEQFRPVKAEGKSDKPQGRLAEAIDTAFGSFEEFQKKMATAATTLFGSGWAWLAQDNEGKLVGIDIIKNGQTASWPQKIADYNCTLLQLRNLSPSTLLKNRQEHPKTT